jgi:hypothetical protein
VPIFRIIAPIVFAMALEPRVKTNPSLGLRWATTFGDLHTIYEEEEVMAVEMHHYAWSDGHGLGLAATHSRLL